MPEQADGGKGCRANTVVKKRHRRKERRKAKRDPEAPPKYRKYDGYVS